MGRKKVRIHFSFTFRRTAEIETFYVQSSIISLHIFLSIHEVIITILHFSSRNEVGKVGKETNFYKSEIVTNLSKQHFGTENRRIRNITNIRNSKASEFSFV